MSLCGTAETHCCWLGSAGECRFILPSKVDGFRWKCGLRAKYGSWGAAHASKEYQRHVQPWMFAAGYQIECGDWPPKGMTCNDCGEIGK